MAVCECLQGIGYGGWGERGQAGSGGRQMPPIPGAGGNPELRYRALLAGCWWRGRAVSQYGSWHSQHQVTRQVITCQLLLTPEWVTSSVSREASDQLGVSSDNTEHWAPEETGVWPEHWALSETQEFLEESSAPAASSAESPPAKLSSRVQTLLLGLLLEQNQFPSSQLLLSRNLPGFRAFSTPFLRVASSREKGSCSGNRFAEEANVSVSFQFKTFR